MEGEVLYLSSSIVIIYLRESKGLTSPCSYEGQSCEAGDEHLSNAAHPSGKPAGTAVRTGGRARHRTLNGLGRLI